MVTRAQHGRLLLQQSFSLLFSHKKLLLLPLVGALLDLLILSVIVSPVRYYEHLQQPLNKFQLEHFIFYYILYLIFLLFTNLIFYFANAALTVSMNQINQGQPPALWGSLRQATSRYGWIALWVTFTSTIGIFVALTMPLFRRFKFHQQKFANQPWAVASYFAIPILLEHNFRPLQLIQYNANLVKETWGAPVRPRYTIIGLLALLIIPSLLPLLIGLGLGGHSAIITGIFITAVLMLLIGVFYLSSRTILIWALYRYALDRRVMKTFDRDLLANAFQDFSW